MPIFKYGSSEVIEAIVDGLFESLPLLSIDGFTGGLGDFRIPFVGIDGFTSDISGDISLLPLGADGFAGADGSVYLGLLEFSGGAFNVNGGSVGIHLLGFYGEFGASGDVELPWDASGDVSVVTLANGILGLQGLDIDGVMATESHVWLRRIGVSGYSGVGSFADVDVNLHFVGVAGKCISTGFVSGTVEIPMMSLNGMAGVGVGVDGDFSLRLIGVGGSASTGVWADGVFSLSLVVVDGSASTGVGVDGDFSLRLFGVDGLAEHSQYANGIVHLMSYGASGLVSLYVERVGSGTVSVARLGVSGLAFSDAVTAEGDDEVIRYSDDRRLI